MTHLRSHLAPLQQIRAHADPQKCSPPRITSNVKTSLKLLTMLKELGNNANKQAKPATSYRKKKVDKKSLPEDFESYEDPATQVIDCGKEITIIQPVLLVDGYNMCGVWPKLKKHFARGDLLSAREKLIDELVTFSAARGMKVVVVFDAKESGLPSHRESRASVDIVFAADACADSWIEREVYLLRDDGCPKIRVVTSDSLHQQVANGAGAYVWSCKGLIGEIKDVRKELEQLLHSDRPYSMKGKLLEHNLSPDVFTSLQALKQRLKMEEELQKT
ncbi:hypothetical protein SELMODRAFT_141908 [Selaginella moellendorffii]|uniref:NYN domain-containing protein n=1 Tax=Selaginella moellendorffii TaxID=88036 RepID=D8QWU0_SELML|nr:uncharacterized protein LOC9655418 [Selaginella moellendorffii]EFJ35293.1 hypothetical protein SELMODRAFT_141908 [Selaginella moellendorffii]|eukprot:XP_002963422.1 uncharacterized protein LOC9655418 [Selaginella moellendorffii]